MIFEYFAKKLIGYDENKAPNKKLRDCFQAFMDGIISFPLNIAGTAYHACLQVLETDHKTPLTEILLSSHSSNLLEFDSGS